MLSLLDAPWNQAGCTVTVSSNIQQYLAQAVLPNLRLAPCTPSMPPDKYKSHRNNLTIRPERYRKLRQIHRIKNNYVDRLTLEFVRNHVPSAPTAVSDTDPETGEMPCIPCKGYDIPDISPFPLKRIGELGIVWIENIVLRTIQRILQMIPEYQYSMKDYGFTCPDTIRDCDHNIFQYFMWERVVGAAGTSGLDDKPIKLILAYQPPWIMSPRDFDQFVSERIIPSYDSCQGSNQKRFNSAHKVWGKLFDICKRNDCPRFVLTNYNQWVFGGFSSQSWEYGFTTRVKQVHSLNPKKARDSKNKGKEPISRTPTILEYLSYWIISSMSLPDSFLFPAVLEMVDLEMAVDDATGTPGLEQQYQDDFPLGDYEPSESTWSGNSDDTASSAGVQFDLESDSGNTPPPYMDRNWEAAPTVISVERGRRVEIDSWLNKNTHQAPAVLLPPPTIPRIPSPAPSGWSEDSLATAQPHRCQGFISMETHQEEVYEVDYENMVF
ncbi:hypothetical protein M0805_003071 [Coniferiporia weirii]|nr:hypothetical protein M0805_003071 [Coniferiporia weirii]